MSSEVSRLRAYAERTAIEIQGAGVPLEGPLITTYRSVVRREGFLGMRTVSTREEGPDAQKRLGWLLWSHVWKEAEVHEWSATTRRRRDPRLSHRWTITRGWWLVPSGSIDIVDHREEYIFAIGKLHKSIEERRPATDLELVYPDLPWRRWGYDDKKSLLYEHGQAPAHGVQAKKPGLRLSTALTNLRKAKGTYVQRRS